MLSFLETGCTPFVEWWAALWCTDGAQSMQPVMRGISLGGRRMERVSVNSSWQEQGLWHRWPVQTSQVKCHCIIWAQSAKQVTSHGYF